MSPPFQYKTERKELQIHVRNHTIINSALLVIYFEVGMPLKVYYLDDEPDICDVFKENFSTSDISISTFTSPKEALDAIHQAPPDLIFLDYRLPNITGDRLAESIKISVPIVLLTGDLGIESSFNFDKIYSKQPFPWDEIESYLKEHHQKKLKQEAV